MLNKKCRCLGQPCLNKAFTVRALLFRIGNEPGCYFPQFGANILIGVGNLEGLPEFPIMD